MAENSETQKIQRALLRLKPRELEILGLLLDNETKGQTAEDVRKIIKISKTVISSHLSSLRKKNIAKSIDEQGENHLWTKRYFIEQNAIEAIEQLLLGIIIDNPGILTLEIAEKTRFTYKFTHRRLQILTEKGYVRAEQSTIPTEKWFTTLEDA